MNRNEFIVCCLLIIAGCNKENPITSDADRYIISGKITEYTLGSGVQIKMEVGYEDTNGGITSFEFGKSDVDQEGNFRLSVIAPLDKFLSPKFKNGAVYSDTSALFYYHTHFSVYKNGGYVGMLSCSEKPLDSTYSFGSFEIYYLYSTKNVTISGMHSIPSPTGLTVMNYHLTANAGWNDIAFNYSLINDTTYHIDVTNISTQKGQWFFTALSSN